MILAPAEIEAESFRLIEKELTREGYSLSDPERPFVLRVVHACGDISLAKDLVFHPEAISSGLSALKDGAVIISDVQMVLAGINRKRCEALGVKAFCFLSDEEVVQQAQETGLTRSYWAMKKALKIKGKKILVIGNAPTALWAVLEHLNQGGPEPDLIIGVPVGFVGAPEYKEKLLQYDVPFITLRGTRGGTPVAVALMNAFLILASDASSQTS